MTKVLFLTGRLKSYRVPILSIIGRLPDIDLTVAHGGKPLGSPGNGFKEVIVRERSLLGFSIHRENLTRLCNEFDVVVAMFYVQKLSYLKLAFERNRKFKLIYWGIGVKASQTSRYDTPGLSNVLRNVLVKKSDAMIFYSDYPVHKYASKGVDPDKLFVMHNTVEVLQRKPVRTTRDTILFIGTLNQSKRIGVLLENYLLAYKENPDIPMLVIIGDGPDYSEVKEFVRSNNLGGKIDVKGAVFEENELASYFDRALACLSPGQAGLSVLKSMGYGVPFITHENAFTGGERFNIQNGINGILFHSEDELKSIILSIASDSSRYIRMGENAREFYWSNRTPAIMAQGFIDAIRYVIRL